MENIEFQPDHYLTVVRSVNFFGLMHIFVLSSSHQVVTEICFPCSLINSVGCMYMSSCLHCIAVKEFDKYWN